MVPRFSDIHATGDHAPSGSLADLATPCLIVDRARLDANLNDMDARAKSLGVSLRPHMKTSKCLAVARRLGPERPICVSSLEEAAYFFEGGYRDICCPNVVAPGNVAGYAGLVQRGARVTLCVADSASAFRLTDEAAALQSELSVLVEVESGGGRTGMAPDSPDLVETAALIHVGSHTRLAGVMTYGGQAYAAHSRQDLAAAAEAERSAVVSAAARLKAAGLPCETLSIGSTPSTAHAKALDGVTEIRPGNYMFLDGMQVALGSGREERIALSVLASVLFCDPAAGKIVIDAGALALSKDRDADGFGTLAAVDGTPFEPKLHVRQLYQEHGVIHGLNAAVAEALPIGAKVRVVPYHACLTAAAYDCYYVVEGGVAVVDRWHKLPGTYH